MTEVALREIVFSNDKKLTLSLIIEKKGDRNTLQWAVSSDGRSNSPVKFYNESSKAIEEFKKRCGEEALSGLTAKSNDIYGSLTGYYISEDTPATTGYRVVQRTVEESEIWKRSILIHRKETLKIRP